MNFIKRAFLSVKARKGKSILQLVIFTAICVLVLSGLSIQTAANKSAELAKQSLGSEVTLSADREKLMEQQRQERENQENSENREPVRLMEEPVAVEDANELLSLSQIKGYNYYSTTFGVAGNFDPIETESTSTTNETNKNGQGPGFGGGISPSMADADISLQGVAFTDTTSEFMDGDAEMVEGTHLSDDHLNKNVAIIEETLAEENELVVGDQLEVTSSTDEDTTVEVEIIGIYKTSSISTDSGMMNFTAMNPYNKVYVPYTLVNELKGEDYKDTIESAVYYMNDPADTDSFIEDAEATGAIDTDIFKLDANDQLYQQMVEPINNVASFSKNVVYLVTIAGAIILGLIVMLGIRERKYEMGVLLAIGEKKSKLIGQFIVEILIIAVFALGIASVTGNVAADKIGDQLLSQQVETDTQSTMDPFGGKGMQMEGGMGPGMGGGGNAPGAPNQAQVETAQVDDLDVKVTASDLGMLTGIGLLIAILATLIPSLSILRLQPKAILSRQD
ncbi:ABC transporter permease [Bacillus sp. FJAT-27986]|uniref:ABC transporter permease n=1 Tax=Bacillus sp. FJAT-27986 TaxID=1743146 RepID=UPI00080AD0D5|nr:ABC transporter permease [Bacillus sp. FJAT-27986]OCA84793.1 macrolide ABC transporter permease [Bacillus sp. FJAT-27986]